MIEEKYLIPKLNLLQLEEKYLESITLIGSFLESIKKVETIYKIFFGKDHSPLPWELHRHNERQLIRQLKYSAWYSVIRNTQIDNLISQRKREELNRKLENDEFPDFSAENVENMIRSMVHNINDLIGEAATEVYEMLRPRRTGYKTNESPEGFPEKVILGWMLDDWYLPKIHFGAGTESRLKDLDNVCSLLDGKGPVKYPGDLATKLREHNIGETVETEYFIVKCYKNRNMHITFKRMDLMNKIAQLGSKNEMTKGKSND